MLRKWQVNIYSDFGILFVYGITEKKCLFLKKKNELLYIPVLTLVLLNFLLIQG